MGNVPSLKLRRGSCLLRHHEELLSISSGSTGDPEPLVVQFHECLKAIDASGAGALDEKAAKRQLLAALAPHFYQEVITPLRLDNELTKVSLEEIYTHVLEVTAAPSPPHVPAAAYAAPHERDVRSFVEEFQRVIRDAAALLEDLKHVGEDAHADPPLERRFGDRQKGSGGECPLCPGHYHDTARCPAMCGDCDVGLYNAAMEMDHVVSAFQAAFDDEDDAAFAELCQQHDQPLVREESGPFTYPAALGIGLRAQYARYMAFAYANCTFNSFLKVQSWSTASTLFGFLALAAAWRSIDLRAMARRNVGVAPTSWGTPPALAGVTSIHTTTKSKAA
ncbi:hypothetical protein CYMTET_13123 [Cymbomonas tetramitiformis]|uniref:Uncharacterized protein n=1 Tax=Cymbomonas tetramitiformis TaxID=36881 RepID=A0AAE0LBD7_9CHLO|nr:hypothetical protein CYMTET_13123 [Cymbomonas tetramitiformis]